MIREHLNSADGAGKEKMKWAAFYLSSYDPSLSHQEKKELLLLSANLGHCNAQKTVGEIMLTELEPEGIPYAESALIAGDKAAGYDLGYYYYNTGQRKLAKTYWTIAADAGVSLAESHLGWYFYGTTGNCPDRQKSLDYLLKACMKNEPQAFVYLAQNLEWLPQTYALRRGAFLQNEDAQKHLLECSAIYLTCKNCFVCKSKEASLECSKRKLYKYCGGSCQRNDWKYHKKHCKYLADKNDWNLTYFLGDDFRSFADISKNDFQKI